MKGIRIKQVVAGLLVVCFVFSQGLVALRAETDQETYARMFYEVMSKIEANYTGQITRKEMFEAAMQGMFDSLDQYSDFFDNQQSQQFIQNINQNFQGIGIQFQREKDNYVVIRLIPGGSAGQEGVLVGDILLTADGVSLKDLSTEEVVAKITGPKGTYVNLSVQRANRTLNFKLERREIHLATANQVALQDLAVTLPQGINPAHLLYVRLDSFGQATAQELRDIMTAPANAKAKVLILDLRNNGGGYVDAVVEIGKMLLPKGKIVTFKDKGGREESYFSDLQTPPYRKIIALINHNSASSSEILAGALKDSGLGILVGENTFGKGVAQVIWSLNQGEYAYKFTYKEFFTPAGHSVNQVGIAPHIYERTPKYIVSDQRFFVGDENKAIYQVEDILNYLGYYPKQPDQIYGPDTVAALYAFQKEHGLGEHIVIDFTSQAALNTALRQFLAQKDRVMDRAVEESVKVLLTDEK